MGIFEKFKIGFKKSASTFTTGLRNIIVKKEIDDKTLDQVEDYLIKSDVGVDAASEIKEIISSEKIDPKKETINEVNLILKNYIIKLMRPLENNNFFNKNDKLKIILISGVNGVGKTTTIGKIGKILKSTNDGFEIAEEDMRIRGYGDILGYQQSGIKEFKLADPIHHEELFRLAEMNIKEIENNEN